MKSKTWQSAELLWSLCTTNELMNLLDHPSAMVKAYAFSGLIDRKTEASLLRKIIRDFSEDGSLLSWKGGCVGGKMKLPDLLHVIYFQTYPETIPLPEK